MELPEKYDNWIEFAKEIMQINEDKVNFFEHDFKIRQSGTYYRSFLVNDIKAKAFDELMDKVDFNFGHVMQFKDAALSQGTHFDAINSITDLLLSLINDR